MQAINKDSKHQTFLSQDAIHNIEEVIAESEKNTSAEIRLFVEKKCSSANPLDRCKKVFRSLEMEKTADRNGVLLYIAYEDHQIAIYGDKNINKCVSKGFWNSTLTKILSKFHNGDYELGIKNSIREIGEKLKTFFPYQSDDVNELSNEIVFGKDVIKKQ